MNEVTESLADPVRECTAPPLGFEAEADLVERAKRDPAAFGELYEAHYSSILNYLYRRTLSAALAEELTSNTFFKALRGLPAFSPRPAAPFRAWLYRIATNEAGMHWRGRRARGAEPLPLDDGAAPRIRFVWPETESPEETAAKRASFALAHKALEQVPEPYRSALELRYFEKLSYEEIAAVLSKPLGTIKSLIHRGLEHFAEAAAKIDATQ